MVFLQRVVSLVGTIAALLVLLWTDRVFAYSPSSGNVFGDRRAFLESASTAAAAASFLLLVVSCPLQDAHAADVLSAGKCTSGVGDGCEDLAEGNAFIQDLQAKSAANRDLYEKQALDAYYMKNYPDFFASLYPPKYLLKKSTDGTYVIVTDAELAKLKAANKITIENPKAMGGKVMDYTQKPIMVLKED